MGSNQAVGGLGWLGLTWHIIHLDETWGLGIWGVECIKYVLLDK
jgi:hypothetical protein